MKSFDIEERVSQAVHNFGSGYNCVQSVFLAYSDVFKLDLEPARKMSVPFGEDVGHIREVCGTVDAIVMLAEFRYPVFDPLDQEARVRNYSMVRKIAALFKKGHGAIVCHSLFPPEETSTNPAPSAHTQQYYAKYPYGRYVKETARVAEHVLKGKLE